MPTARLLVLVLGLVWTLPCLAQGYGSYFQQAMQATASAPINISTATTTQIVPLSVGIPIYVVSWDVVVSAADNITFEYGTGTACGTGTTALTGAYNFAANGGLSAGSGSGVILFVPPGNALCIVTSAGAQASGRVSYAQF